MKKIKKENIITYWDNFNLNLYTRILNLKNIRKMAKKVDLNGHRQVKDSVYENTRARQTAKIRAIAVIREMLMNTIIYVKTEMQVTCIIYGGCIKME